MNLEQHAHLTRQMGLINVDKLSTPVTVIGCGAIGSFVTLSLAKMGMTDITVFDHDEVSVENMNCQFYRHSDIGSPKAMALLSLVHDFTGVAVKPHMRKFEAGDAVGASQIVVMAVDSMDARKELFQALRDSSVHNKWVIDPRMGAEFFTMFVMQPTNDTDMKTYSKVCQSDGESVQEACTAKSTIYTATLASGLVVKAVKNLLMDQTYPRITNWNIAESSNPMVMNPGNPPAPVP